MMVASWKGFELGRLADVDSGKDIYAQERTEGKTPYITSGTANNGIGFFVGNDNKSKIANAISVNRNGAVGEAFYHPYQALYGNDCRKVKLYGEKNSDVQLFVAHCIANQKSSFSYSRKLGTARLKRLHFMLPATNGGTPDWNYMCTFVQSMRIELFQRYKKYVEKKLSDLEHKVIPALSEAKWKPFMISNVFRILPGKRLVAADASKGTRPFIGALDNSNGIARFVSNTNDSLDKNVLGVNYNGNGMGIGFYHPYECIFSDDVKRFHLKHHEDNKYIFLFMKVAILMQKQKFGYLYKFNAKRMEHTNILLPVNTDGEPDYAYMEQYAKNLMLRKYRQYLSYLEKKKQNKVH